MGSLGVAIHLLGWAVQPFPVGSPLLVQKCSGREVEGWRAVPRHVCAKVTATDFWAVLFCKWTAALWGGCVPRDLIRQHLLCVWPFTRCVPNFIFPSLSFKPMLDAGGRSLRLFPCPITWESVAGARAMLGLNWKRSLDTAVTAKLGTCVSINICAASYHQSVLTNVAA